MFQSWSAPSSAAWPRSWSRVCSTDRPRTTGSVFSRQGMNRTAWRIEKRGFGVLVYFGRTLLFSRAFGYLDPQTTHQRGITRPPANMEVHRPLRPCALPEGTTHNLANRVVLQICHFSRCKKRWRPRLGHFSWPGLSQFASGACWLGSLPGRKFPRPKRSALVRNESTRCT